MSFCSRSVASTETEPIFESVKEDVILPPSLAAVCGVSLVLIASSFSCAAVRGPSHSGATGSSDYSSHVRWINSLDPRTFDAPAGRNAYGAPKSTVTVPMYFPILGKGYGFSDEFGAQRNGHRHIGQDLFAPKMTPLVAVFDGTVYFWSSGGRDDGTAPHNIINLRGDNGYTVKYMHVNNDRPGTNDGKGGPEYAFAPGLESGQHVRAGQFIGWVGNSGNAESTPAHTHFELWGPDGMVTNATASLRQATRSTKALPDISVRAELPAVDQIRWDGVVNGIDPTRGVVILRLLATADKRGVFAATKPGLAYVRVAPKTVVRQEDNGQVVRFSEIRPGQRISLVGKIPTKSRPFVATIAKVAPDYGAESWTTRVSESEPSQRSPDLSRRIRDWWNGVKRRGRL